jgi:hypothetical protein
MAIKHPQKNSQIIYLMWEQFLPLEYFFSMDSKFSLL